MAKKRYKPIPLTGATKIMRAHSTQIEPPGLLEMKDLFLSRSDNAITLRSDWQPAYAGMFSFSSLLQGTNTEDYLNTGFYVNRAGHTIWFSRLCPFVWDGTTFGLLSTIYNEGTVTTDGSQKIVEGAGSAWHQKVWPGCLIREKGEANDLYTIKEVVSDVRINTFTAMPVLTDAEYEILRVHPRYRAEWPIRLEALGGFLVYGVADMAQPIDEQYLSGPWFSNIGRPNLGVWIEDEQEFDEDEYNFVSLSFPYRANTLRHQDKDYMRTMNSPLIVVGRDSLAFQKNWLADGSVVSLRDYPEARSPAVRLALGGSYQVNRIQGNYILCDDGKYIILDISDDIAPNYPVGWTQDGPYKSLWRDSGGLAWGDPSIFNNSTSGTDHLYGVLSVIGDNYFYGANGYFDGYSTGVTVDLFDADYSIETGGNERGVIVGANDGTEAVALYYATSPSLGITQGVTGVTDDDLLSVTYCAPYRRFIAVGTSGACATSDDNGATWSIQSVAGTTTDLARVCCDPDGYVCVAVGGDATNGALAFVTQDGVTWQEITIDCDDPLLDIYYHEQDGYFYFVSSGSQVFRWRKTLYISPASTGLGYISDTRNEFITDVIWDGSNFITVGRSIHTSPTGATWTLREEDTDEYMFCVCKQEFDGDLMAGGADGIGYHSTDGGVNWTKRTIDSNGGSVIGIVSAATQYHDGKFVAATMDGFIFTSPDGITWTKDATFSVTNNNILSISKVALLEWGGSGSVDYVVVAITTQNGTVYFQKIEMAPAWVENGWVEWTNNPGAVWTTNSNCYGAAMTFENEGSEVPRIFGSSGGDGQVVNFNIPTPLGAIGTVNNPTIKAWLVGFEAPTNTVAAMNSVAYIRDSDVDGLGIFYSPIIAYWVGGLGTQIGWLVSSFDYGRTWSTSFGDTGLGTNPYHADAPKITVDGGIMRSRVYLGIKANSSDTHSRSYDFRPMCTDGTYFYAAFSVNYGVPPKFVVFDGGIVLGDYKTGAILEAEEYS